MSSPQDRWNALVRFVPSDKFERMGILGSDPQTVYYNEEWWNSLNEKEQNTIIIHEFHHQLVLTGNFFGG